MAEAPPRLLLKKVCVLSNSIYPTYTVHMYCAYLSMIHAITLIFDSCMQRLIVVR